MRRGITVAVAVVLSAAAVGLGAGCGGSDPSAASTPADATTIANNAVQTDSTGKTVPAPGASSGAASGSGAADGEASGAASGGAADSGGDAAAGKTVFVASCQGCHPSAGMAAGVGPQPIVHHEDGRGTDQDTDRDRLARDARWARQRRRPGQRRRLRPEHQAVSQRAMHLAHGTAVRDGSVRHHRHRSSGRLNGAPVRVSHRVA